MLLTTQQSLQQCSGAKPHLEAAAIIINPEQDAESVIGFGLNGSHLAVAPFCSCLVVQSL